MARMIEADPYEGSGALQFTDGEGAGEEPFDFQGSGETEDEDQFVSGAIRRAAKLVQRAKPWLNHLKPLAVRAVASAVPGGALVSGLLSEDPEGLGEEFGDPEDPFDFQGSFEDEDEAAVDGETGYLGEDESETTPLAETLLAEAARVDSDTEAAALAGGITITITGPAPLVVRRVAPVISTGTARLVRILRSKPATRPLVPVAGAIARSTTRALTRRAAAGKPVTPTVAAKVMARQTQRTLGKPSQVAKAVVRNAVQRRRLNTQAIRRAER